MAEPAPTGGAGIAIADLRARPDFAAAVADRIWRAWWRDGGTALADIEARVAATIAAATVPFCRVAHDGADFAGTVSVIPSDLAERPHLAPWLAALWVEPDRRGRGIGSRLLADAIAHAFALGTNRLYLCARPQLVDFYRTRGWRLMEEAVGDHRLLVFYRDADG